MSTLAGKARLLFSETRAAAVTWAIMKPELTPLSSTRKGGRPLILGSTSTAVRRSEMRADLAQRHRQHVGGEGDRLGVEIAARQRSSLAEQQRIVGDRIGLDLERARRIAHQVERRRPSPAAGSGSCRGPAPGRNRRGEWRISLSVEQAAAAPPRPRSGPAGRAPRGCAGRRRRRCPSARRATARRRSAPAANTRSAVNRVSSAIAVETWVPLISASPSLGPSTSGSSPSRASASPAGMIARRRASIRPSPSSAALRWASGARSPEAPTEPWLGMHRQRVRLEQGEQPLDHRRAARRYGRGRGRSPSAPSSAGRSARSSASPSPQLCDRIRLRCSSASRSSGIRVWASRPKPVLTP